MEENLKEAILSLGLEVEATVRHTAVIPLDLPDQEHRQVAATEVQMTVFNLEEAPRKVEAMLDRIRREGLLQVPHNASWVFSVVEHPVAEVTHLRKAASIQEARLAGLVVEFQEVPRVFSVDLRIPVLQSIPAPVQYLANLVLVTLDQQEIMRELTRDLSAALKRLPLMRQVRFFKLSSYKF